MPPKPIQVRGSVKPHRHTDKMRGPHLFALGKQSQPPLVAEWNSKNKALLCIEQPNDDNNFSLVHILFLLRGRPKPYSLRDCKFHKVAFHSKKGGTLFFYIKKRYTDTLLHPLPVGPYQGTCQIGSDRAVYTFQASTLVKAAEPSKPKTIITPGDVEYDLTLANAKRTLLRNDGVGGRGTDAGGLCHGQLPVRLPTGVRRKGLG